MHGVKDLHARLAPWRQQGQRIALVPTMGNLHRGHLELVRAARRQADRVVASVFVNPLQFAAGEDFERYPRTLAEDRAALQGEGADVLFAPDAAEVYPRGMEGLTRVSVPGLSEILCGAYRPGHFDGVATVVNLLLNLVQPHLALFGEKDYQQLLIIRRMVEDLHVPVEIVGVATQRENDGLALSSRNQYLSDAERRQAPGLYQALVAAAEGLRRGRTDYGALEREGEDALSAAGLDPQYFAVRTPELQVPAATTREFVVLAAAQLGSTRLIDNLRSSR